MKIFLYFLLTIVVACSQTRKSEVPTIKGTGKLISIDFADSNYRDIASYATDTTTIDGWSIKYYVKDDSTKYSDLYIEWSKGNRKGMCKQEQVLELRRYFIPTYRGENEKHLFLKHACATTCMAVLILNKDSALSYQDYQDIFDYDISLEYVVQMTNKSARSDSLEIAVVDLDQQEAHTILFDNACLLSPEYGCIDSVISKGNELLIKATVTDWIDRKSMRKEIKAVRLRR